MRRAAPIEPNAEERTTLQRTVRSSRSSVLADEDYRSAFQD